MRKCVLCGKVDGPGSFFNVPRDERRKGQWSIACRMQFEPNSKVCSDHFLTADIIHGARMKLMPSAVPSLGIFFKEENESLIELPSSSDDCEHHSYVDRNSMLSIELSPQTESKDLPTEELDNFIKQENPDYSYDMVEENSKVLKEEFKLEQISCCTQTENDILISTSEIENYNLRNQMKKLKSENAKMKKELNEAKRTIDTMKSIFTESQIRKMANPEKNIKWRPEDIAKCMSLYTSGPKAYSHVYQEGFPLPDVSTLKRWARK